MAKNARLNIAIMPSTKDRLVRFCKEKDISMGDVVDDALKNFFERLDRSNSAPDLVLDRINQLTLSVMQANLTLGQIKDYMESENNNG